MQANNTRPSLRVACPYTGKTTQVKFLCNHSKGQKNPLYCGCQDCVFNHRLRLHVHNDSDNQGKKQLTTPEEVMHKIKFISSCPFRENLERWVEKKIKVMENQIQSAITGLQEMFNTCQVHLRETIRQLQPNTEIQTIIEKVEANRWEQLTCRNIDYVSVVYDILDKKNGNTFMNGKEVYQRIVYTLNTVQGLTSQMTSRTKKETHQWRDQNDTWRLVNLVLPNIENQKIKHELRQLNSRIEKHPDYLDLYLQRAEFVGLNCWDSRDAMELVLKDAEKYLQLAKKPLRDEEYRAKISIGKAYMNLEDYKKAEQAFKSVIDVGLREQNYHYNANIRYARCLLFNDKYPQARRACIQAQKARRNCEDARKLMRDIERKMEEERESKESQSTGRESCETDFRNNEDQN